MASNTVQLVEGAHFYQPDRRANHHAVSDVETSPDGKDWTHIGHERVYERLGELGLYAALSYNLAPPLRRELERVARTHDTSDPAIADAVRTTVAAMEQPLAENGIAMTAIHAIHPHISRLDKQILVRAGIRDFTQVAGKKPSALWLPEGAVDTETLTVLADNGIHAFICAPEQINADEPKRIRLARDLGIIAIPFDSNISRELAFDHDRRTNADRFAARVIMPIAERKRYSHNRYPIVIWVDGETYGMYDEQKEVDPRAHGSDRFLAHLIRESLPRMGIEVIPLNRMVTQLIDDPNGVPEGHVNQHTAWSCSDGLVRWSGERDCPESGGAQWKRPFYAAHEWLNDAVTTLVRRELGEAGADNDEAFVQRVVNEFSEAFMNPGGHQSTCEQSLVSAKVAALASRASCGTFYDNPGVSGWQNIVFARAAIEHLIDAGLHSEADDLWKNYLRIIRQMPTHYLNTSSQTAANRTSLHLINR